MTETLDYSPELLGERALVRNRRQEEPTRARLDDAKALYLQSIAQSSPEYVQPNWGRVVIHAMRALEAPARAIADCVEFVNVSAAGASTSSAKFIESAARLDNRGRTDSALDLLYDSIDAMIRDGRLQELDSILAEIHEDRFSVDLLLGFLTATLPARNRLRFRKEFLKRVEKSIRRRGEWEHGLLAGL